MVFHPREISNEEGNRLSRLVKLKNHVETVRRASHQLGERESGIVSFVRFLRENEVDAAQNFTRAPSPVTRQTRLVDVARRIMDQRFNGFPIVDEHARVVAGFH